MDVVVGTVVDVGTVVNLGTVVDVVVIVVVKGNVDEPGAVCLVIEMTFELVMGRNFPDLAIFSVNVHAVLLLIVNFDEVNLHKPFTDQVFLPTEFEDATADNAIVCPLRKVDIFHVTRVDEAASTC